MHMSEKPPRPTSPIISNPSSLKSSLSNWNGASPPVLDGPNTRNRLSQTITNYSNLNGNPPPFGYTRSHQYSNSVGGESNLGNRDGDQDLKMSLKEWKEWDGSYGNGRSSLNSSNGRYVEPPRFQEFDNSPFGYNKPYVETLESAKSEVEYETSTRKIERINPYPNLTSNYPNMRPHTSYNNSHNYAPPLPPSNRHEDSLKLRSSSTSSVIDHEEDMGKESRFMIEEEEDVELASDLRMDFQEEEMPSPHKTMSKEEWLRLGGFEDTPSIPITRDGYYPRDIPVRGGNYSFPTTSESASSSTTSSRDSPFQSHRMLASTPEKQRTTRSSKPGSKVPSTPTKNRSTPYGSPSKMPNPLQASFSINEPVLPPLPSVSKSHSRKKSIGHIPRPRNAFILFRSNAVTNTKSLVTDNNKSVSKVVGEIWKALSEQERSVWHDLAEEEKRLHHIKWPNYKFSPKKKRVLEEKKKKVGREDEEEGEGEAEETDEELDISASSKKGRTSPTPPSPKKSILSNSPTKSIPTSEITPTNPFKHPRLAHRAIQTPPSPDQIPFLNSNPTPTKRILSESFVIAEAEMQRTQALAYSQFSSGFQNGNNEFLGGGYSGFDAGTSNSKRFIGDASGRKVSVGRWELPQRKRNISRREELANVAESNQNYSIDRKSSFALEKSFLMESGLEIEENSSVPYDWNSTETSFLSITPSLLSKSEEINLNQHPPELFHYGQLDLFSVPVVSKATPLYRQQDDLDVNVKLENDWRGDETEKSWNS